MPNMSGDKLDDLVKYSGVEYWVLGIGYWVLGNGYWVLGTGCGLKIRFSIINQQSSINNPKGLSKTLAFIAICRYYISHKR